MSVYFIESSGLIKIGFSQDVRQRVGKVISELRDGGKYLGYMAGDRKVERHLHGRFAEHREYGEWFRTNIDLSNFISAAADTSFPDGEKVSAPDRIRQQEERYADECATYLRYFFDGKLHTEDHWRELSAVIGIPTHRLKSIYGGSAEYVTAGEYVVLRDLGFVSMTTRGEA